VNSLSSPAPVSVAALYRFTRFAECAAMRAPLERLCRQCGVFGTLLLAPEGINGTIAGPPDRISAVLDYVRGLPGCAELDVKLSGAATLPFHRMKVRVKREIVTMGEPDIDPRANAGTYVEPAGWNLDIRSGYDRDRHPQRL
jgi:UPF0176 protein